MMSDVVREAAWPLERIPELLVRMAPRREGAPIGPRPLAVGGQPLGPEQVARWIRARARGLGLVAEPVGLGYDDLAGLLRGGSTVVIELPQPEGPPTFVVITSRPRRGRVELEHPTGARRAVPIDALARVLRSGAERPFAPDLDAVLEGASIRGRRARAARESLLRAIVGSQPVTRAFIVTPRPEPSWRGVARDARLHRRLPALAGLHALRSLSTIVVWAILGRVLVSGHLDLGLVFCGLLLLVGGTALGVSIVSLVHHWSVALGASIKLRVMEGILALSPESIRHEGTGRLLGRVFDQSAFETSVMEGAPLGVLALVELAAAAVVLALTSAGHVPLVLLAGWAVLSALVLVSHARQQLRWTEVRRAVTHEVIEGIQGHRARLAQCGPERWHEREEVLLDEYRHEATSMDRRLVAVRGVLPRGWLAVGLAGLLPAVLGGASVGAMAAAIGGVLLAWRALQELVRSASSLVSAGIAAAGLDDLIRAPAAEPPVDDIAMLEPDRRPHEELLRARHLEYRYPAGRRSVLTDCTLSLRTSERVLLEAPSGAGKSTLVSLLCGQRRPTSGTLLLDGIDRGSLDVRAWRRRVVSVPQFHHNHLFSGTLAFNVLLGGQWPPSAEDLVRARVVLEELGLGPLLERMPSGLEQVVGETGWQLSHGERSRVFVARALLQPGELVIMDESFGALDPKSLLQCLRVVCDRAPTFLLVAHR